MPRYAYIDRRTGGVARTVESDERPVLSDADNASFELREVSPDVEAGMTPEEHPDLSNLALLLEAQRYQ